MGALAFFLAQVVLRLPLLNFAVPALPEPFRDLLLNPAALSFSAGIFEETARLVLMLVLLKGFHRWVDGAAFGLGHGGLEAVLLGGTGQIGNLTLSVLINSGAWESVAATMPAAAADSLHGMANWLAVLTMVRFSTVAAEVVLGVIAVLIVLGALRARGAFPSSSPGSVLPGAGTAAGHTS